MSKRGEKTMIIFVVIVTVILVCMLVGSILQSTYFQRKLDKMEPYGQLVDVEDGQMHVYSMGKGENTIVLLPGMGVPLPSVDFAPLMRKLSENYTVVCVEYFGVGFSSETLRPRTSKNYVEETRTALIQAGFSAPFILMAHSISSIYSEHYAAQYPQEVAVVISLDGTSTAYYKEIPGFLKSVIKIAKFQQVIGISSILSHLTVNREDLISKGFTESEIEDVVVMSGFTMNDTVLEQIINSSEFIKQTMDLQFPESVPYFKIISRQTYETENKQLQTMTPQEYQHKHLERIGKHAKYEILEGNHFIYHNNLMRIAEITDDLISKDKK